MCAGLAVYGLIRACVKQNEQSGFRALEVNCITLWSESQLPPTSLQILKPTDPIFGAEPLPIVAGPLASRAEHLLIGS